MDENSPLDHNDHHNIWCSIPGSIVLAGPVTRLQNNSILHTVILHKEFIVSMFHMDTLLQRQTADQTVGHMAILFKTSISPFTSFKTSQQHMMTVFNLLLSSVYYYLIKWYIHFCITYHFVIYSVSECKISSLVILSHTMKEMTNALPKGEVQIIIIFFCNCTVINYQSYYRQTNWAAIIRLITLFIISIMFLLWFQNTSDSLKCTIKNHHSNQTQGILVCTQAFTWTCSNTHTGCAFGHEPTPFDSDVCLLVMVICQKAELLSEFAALFKKRLFF